MPKCWQQCILIDLLALGDEIKGICCLHKWFQLCACTSQQMESFSRGEDLQTRQLGGDSLAAAAWWWRNGGGSAVAALSSTGATAWRRRGGSGSLAAAARRRRQSGGSGIAAVAAWRERGVSGSGQLGGGGGSLARARCWQHRQRGASSKAYCVDIIKC